MKVSSLPSRTLLAAACGLLIAVPPVTVHAQSNPSSKTPALVELDIGTAFGQIRAFAAAMRNVDQAYEAEARAQEQQHFKLLDKAEELLKPHLADATFGRPDAWVNYASILSLRDTYGRPVSADDAALTIAVLQVLVEQGRLEAEEHVRKCMTRLNAVDGVSARVPSRLAAVHALSADVAKADAGDADAAVRVAAFGFAFPGPMSSPEVAGYWLRRTSSDNLLVAYHTFNDYGLSWKNLVLECAKERKGIHADLLAAAHEVLPGSRRTLTELNSLLATFDRIKRDAKPDGWTRTADAFAQAYVNTIRTHLDALDRERASAVVSRARQPGYEYTIVPAGQCSDSKEQLFQVTTFKRSPATGIRIDQQRDILPQRVIGQTGDGKYYLKGV